MIDSIPAGRQPIFVLGAGPRLRASIALRFGRAGFSVMLAARDQARHDNPSPVLPTRAWRVPALT